MPHARRTFIQPSAEPAQFPGLVLLRGACRRLPEGNVRRFRNRLRRLRNRWRAGSVSREDIEQRMGAWTAHAARADTWRLRHAMFKGG